MKFYNLGHKTFETDFNCEQTLHENDENDWKR